MPNNSRMKSKNTVHILRISFSLARLYTESGPNEMRKKIKSIPNKRCKTCERCVLATKRERERERMMKYSPKQMEIIYGRERERNNNQTKMQMNIKLFALTVFFFARFPYIFHITCYREWSKMKSLPNALISSLFNIHFWILSLIFPAWTHFSVAF